MKKILLLLLLFLAPGLAFAQYDSLEADSVAGELDYTTSICGVDFGTDFETAKTILENKFGRESAYAENYELRFRNKSYAGVFFDELIFGFQSDQ